jgi:site-specific DNA-methyltransferase (adenine-specific)
MSDFTKSHISKSDDWRTPQAVINELDQKFHFTRKADGNIFDPTPCPCPVGYDGLMDEWAKCTFFNPPYSKPTPWVKKAYEESLKGKTIVGLLRGDTSTRWFHDWVLGKAELIFVKGRIHFNNLKPAPFASIIAIWHGQGGRL